MPDYLLVIYADEEMSSMEEKVIVECVLGSFSFTQLSVHTCDMITQTQITNGWLK